MTKMVVPETLETKRLTLRPFSLNDWPDIHRYYGDEEALKYSFGQALSEGESWRVMAGMVGHWQFRGYGPYALELTAIKEVIGIAGFWHPNDWPEAEIKYALIRDHWGAGYASEAVRKVQQVASSCFKGKPLISMVHAQNQNSINLALSVGAVFEKQYDYCGHMHNIYRHPVIL